MKKKIITVLAVLAGAVVIGSFMLSGGAQWSGIDDSVVKRIAEENGKTNVGPTFNLQGDLLLFAFLMAGIGGGFLLGYYYRQLFGATPTDKGSKDV